MADHAYSYTTNLSFSSTLLQQICRSIDQNRHEDVVLSMRDFQSDEEMANYRRACMIEKWMDKKVTVRPKSVPDLKLLRKDRQGSSSSSSDSSCGGGLFSSSETECFAAVSKPKPVRVGGELGKKQGLSDQSEQKSKRESGLLKTKSRALKMYGDLKKVKQPISPGGKVAAFLNSLFSAGNMKKPKVESPSMKSNACSSASSFSRSCLSKTSMSSSSKSPGGGKRSVRFSPASILVDENRRKSLNQDSNRNDVGSIKSAIDEEIMMRIRERTRKVEEAARDFLINYQKKELPFDGGNGELEEEEEEDEFDGESCVSSDLFELDNLSAIGMELPVYETTNLEKIQTMQKV